jgi:ADP-ribosylglycohydrolase
MSLRDKVKAMFTGICVGDALGVPYECEYGDYGRVTNYVMKNPKISDDTQLSCAVTAGLIDSGGIDMESQKKRHIEAYETSTFGWGSGTRYAVGKLLNPDMKCPVPKSKPLGAGNGVAMKFAPIGAYLATLDNAINEYDKIAELALFTHPTSLGVAQGFAQVLAIHYCLVAPKFDKEEFVEVVCMGSNLGQKYHPDDCANLTDRLQKVLVVEDIKKEFDNGSPYVYNSLPFSYAYFLKNPHSIETLYDVLSAGGDVDSNASMVGALLGALNGSSIFPAYLTNISVLKDVQEIADAFCDKFGIKD